MAGAHDDFAARAARWRQTWRGAITRDGTHPPMWRMEPEDALAAMWEAAVDAWVMSGRPLPDYDRSEIPGKLIRVEE